MKTEITQLFFDSRNKELVTEMNVCRQEIASAAM